MKEKLRLFAFISAFGLLLATVPGCGSSGEEGASSGGGVSVEKVFQPNTQLAVKADFQAMRDSAFFRLVEEKMEQNLEPEMQAESDRMEAKVKELTGLELEDFGSFALGMSNLDAFATDPSAVTMLAALSLAKPVTLAQIEAVGRFLAEENGETFPGKIEGDRMVFPAEAGMPPIELKVEANGRGSVILVGDSSSVAAGLAGDGRSAVSGLAGTKDGLVNAESGWLAVNLPETARASLREMAANPPPMAPGLSALGALESVSMAVAVADGLDFALGFTLADEASAAQVVQVIDNQLITMVKMFAPMYFQGGLPPMVNSLASGLDGNRAKLSLRVTPQDVEMMQAAALKALGGALGAP